MEPDYEVGQVVLSKAGRDKGEPMIIYDVAYDIKNPEYVYVVNGRNRTVENPKKKNNKHLQKTLKVSCLVAEKIESREIVRNSEVRSELKKLALSADTSFRGKQGG